MSQAVFQHHHQRLDVARIIALSAAISLNASLLLVAMRPLVPQLHETLTQPPLTVHFIATPPKVVTQPLPPIDMPVPPKHTVKHHIPHPVHVVTHAPTSVMSTPHIKRPTSPPVQATPAAATPTPAPSATPIQAHLAYRHAPAPRYPTAARSRHMQGTVLLRVLVDAQGYPRKVQILNSSGSALLDRTARLQVLHHWSFQPAQVDGRHVRAWATVPVKFSLRG